jgi:hypothetical protein
MCDVLVVDSNAQPYGAALETQLDLLEHIMTTHRAIVHLLKREPPGHGAYDLLVLGVAAFVLGVAMVSQGVLLSLSPADLVLTTQSGPGEGESLMPAQGEHPVATMPSANLVPPTPGLPTTRSDGPGGVAVCTPRRALECDLRLGLMEMALQQRGLFLERPVVSNAQDVPRKYCVLARVAESPHATPPPTDPGC